MAKFCTNCGRPLEKGETCNCKENHDSYDSGYDNNRDSYSQADQYGYQHDDYDYEGGDYGHGGYDWRNDFQERITSGFKDRINDYKRVTDDFYSSDNMDDLIVPREILESEGETPIRQYDLNILENKFLGIFTVARSIGRLLVTNKRILYLAQGRNLNGRIKLQHEFDISELAGIEIQKNFVVDIARIIGGLIISLLFMGLIVSIGAGASINSYNYSGSGVVTAFGLILILIGLGLVFYLNDRPFLKLLSASLALSGASMFAGGNLFSFLVYYGSLNFASLIIFIIYLIVFIVYIVQLWFFAQIPNLTLIIKSKASGPVITIKRREKIFGFRQPINDTGFDYVMPNKDAEMTMRELGTLINDIQIHGDQIIERWRV